MSSSTAVTLKYKYTVLGGTQRPRRKKQTKQKQREGEEKQRRVSMEMGPTLYYQKRLGRPGLNATSKLKVMLQGFKKLELQLIGSMPFATIQIGFCISSRIKLMLYD